MTLNRNHGCGILVPDVEEIKILTNDGEIRGVQQRIGFLDGWRGIAIIFVVLFHNNILPSGFLGVDMFFSLSGFILTYLLIKEYERNHHISLSNFWSRRLKRIILPMTTTIMATLIVFIFVPILSIKEQVFHEAFTSAVFVSNWYKIFVGASYWGTGVQSPLVHLWSVSMEMQFYFIWAILVVLCMNAGQDKKKKLFITSAVVFVLSVICQNVIFSVAGLNPTYYNTFSRIASFVAGAIAGTLGTIYESKQNPNQRCMRWAVGFLGAVLIVFICTISLQSSALFIWQIPLFTLAFSMLLVIIFLYKPRWMTGFLELPIMAYAGKISYSWYLCHMPVIAFGTYLAQKNSITKTPVFTFLLISISLLIAMLMYHTLDVTLEKRKWTLHKGMVLTLSSIALIGTGILGVHRMTPVPAQYVSSLEISNEGQSSTLLVLGDSWARYIGQGLAQIAEENKISVINAGIGGTGITSPDFYVYYTGEKVAPTDKDRAYLEEWKYIIQQYRPSAVILLTGNFDQARQIIREKEMRVGDQEFDMMYQEKLKQIISMVIQHNVPILVSNVVDNGRDTMSPEEIHELNQYSDAMNRNIHAVLEQYKEHPLVSFFDLDAILSPDTSICPTKTPEGKNIYDETNHPNEEMCKIIGQHILARVLE